MSRRACIKDFSNVVHLRKNVTGENRLIGKQERVSPVNRNERNLKIFRERDHPGCISSVRRAQKSSEA